MQQGNFNSSVGPDGYMLSAVTCGMSPVTSITEGLQQVKLTHGAQWHPQSVFELLVTRCRPLCRPDRHHGAVPHHRSLLSGEFRQHRATLHDSEGAVESGRQEGIALQLPSRGRPGGSPNAFPMSAVTVADVYSLLLQWRNSPVNFKGLFPLLPGRAIPVIFFFSNLPVWCDDLLFFDSAALLWAKWGQTKYPAAGLLGVGRLWKTTDIRDHHAFLLSTCRKAEWGEGREPVWPVAQNTTTLLPTRGNSDKPQC